MISLKRNIKTFNPGDEVTAIITNFKDNGTNISMELTPLNNGVELPFKIFHTFGAYVDKGRWFFEQFLDCVNAPEEDVSERWFVGKKVSFICKNNEWQGKVYLAVDRFLNTKEERMFEDTLNSDVGFMETPKVIVQTVDVQKPKLKKSIAKQLPVSSDQSLLNNSEVSVVDTV